MKFNLKNVKKNLFLTNRKNYQLHTNIFHFFDELLNFFANVFNLLWLKLLLTNGKIKWGRFFFFGNLTKKSSFEVLGP